MSNVPDRNEFETLANWVDATATNTGIDRDTLWAVTEELKPGARPVAQSKKAAKLRRLFEIHNNREDAPPWRFIDVVVDGDTLYQYSVGAHNLVDLDDEQIENLESIIEEEDLEVVIDNRREGSITVMRSTGGVDEDVRLTDRLLRELHSVTLEDIETAVETVDNDTNVSWTQID